MNFKFQFPSNGKAYPKAIFPGSAVSWPTRSFNSLQTGKRIQSLIIMQDALENFSVSIPFKRESVSKAGSVLEAYTIIGFNSLQTGKRIQSRKRAWGIHNHRFQFPSNGKAYPKFTPPVWYASGLNRFNSLQTGKPIQRQQRSHPDSRDAGKSFNSLQTGKPIQSRWLVIGFLGNVVSFVSIPFKRESVSKACPSWRHWCLRTKFQFPSNGKADPKWIKAISMTQFQSMFQFPSNGKAYPKLTCFVNSPDNNYSFNSLQTGKRIQSLCPWGCIAETEKFQFPSNGKADPKSGTCSWKMTRRLLFQFPSNGKADPKKNLV